jgi:hypothetical protein
MKSSHLLTFTLGVIVTAVSVSAVSYVNALNDKPIKACADRKTGVMRYIDKGRCKRTERALTWNQIGPQGVPGIAGAAGSPGIHGSPGTPGAKLRVVDANGQDMGLLLSEGQGEVTVLLTNKVWLLSSYTSNRARGSVHSYDNHFLDSNCTQEIPISIHSTSSVQTVFNFKGKHWNIVRLEPISNQAVIYQGDGPCRQLSTAHVASWINIGYRIPVIEEIQPPTYTAPLSIIFG